MIDLTKWILFIKDQADRIQFDIENDKNFSEKLKPILAQLLQLADDLMVADSELLRLQSENTRYECLLAERQTCLNQLDLKPADIIGLPPELIAQLSIDESDLADFQVLDLIEESGGTMSLDRIIIGIFRKNGEISDRSKLNARLYRLAQKGLLYPVPGRKATYSIYKQQEEVAQPTEDNEKKPAGGRV